MKPKYVLLIKNIDVSTQLRKINISCKKIIYQIPHTNFYPYHVPRVNLFRLFFMHFRCSHNKKIYHLICSAIQLAGFYITHILAVNRFSKLIHFSTMLHFVQKQVICTANQMNGFSMKCITVFRSWSQRNDLS